MFKATYCAGCGAKMGMYPYHTFTKTGEEVCSSPCYRKHFHFLFYKEQEAETEKDRQEAELMARANAARQIT